MSFGMTIFNIGERAKTNGMIFVQYFGNILWFKLGIREVNFLPKRIVKEGEKLYLSVEIGRTKVLEMSQKHLERSAGRNRS